MAAAKENTRVFWIAHVHTARKVVPFDSRRLQCPSENLNEFKLFPVLVGCIYSLISGPLIMNRGNEPKIVAAQSPDKSTTSHRALMPGKCRDSTCSCIMNRFHLLFVPLVLLLAQFFAVMPIYGINTASAKELRFSWLNLRVLHTVIILCGFLVIITLSTIWAVSSPLSISIIGEYIQIISLCTCINASCFYLYSLLAAPTPFATNSRAFNLVYIQFNCAGEFSVIGQALATLDDALGGCRTTTTNI